MIGARMRRRVWLIVLVLYFVAAVVDGAVHVAEARRIGETMGPAIFAVAFCAGLFWPIDIVARPLLASR
jgi:hypothetical protein